MAYLCTKLSNMFLLETYVKTFPRQFRAGALNLITKCQFHKSNLALKMPKWATNCSIFVFTLSLKS